MTKKEEFFALFKKEKGKKLTKDMHPRDFKNYLNSGSPELRILFREAVAEAAEPTLGMALLFPDTK